jgi:MFS family permease
MTSSSGSGQRAVLRIRDFRFLLAGRFLSSLSIQMQSVAVGWQVYNLTNDPMALGYVGLSLFVPFALLTLPAGDLTDRVDRRVILAFSYLAQAGTSGLFLALTLSGSTEVWPYYAGMALFGAGRAFSGPAQQSFPPIVVPAAQLADAVAWNSSAYQTATIIGPAIGGVLFVFGPDIVYGTCLVLCIGVAGAMTAIRARGLYDTPITAGTTAFGRVREGIIYVARTPILLGAISLDLFAVILGGATALLPIFARDILQVGPEGLGLLRSAPAVGAVATALLLANFPIRRNTGAVMFIGVALYGAATIVFGLSEIFIVSLIALAALGAGDVISVFVRSTIVQLSTPEQMRGRVSAVYMLFVGASNELGEFRAGAMAAWLNAVSAVVIGGVGTLVVVGACLKIFPRLARIDRLTDVTPESAARH